MCELKGARKNAQAFGANILNPNPTVLDRSDKWGTSNNLQRANVASAGNPTGLRQPGMIPATIFDFSDGSKVNSLRNTFFNFPFNTSSAQGGGIAYDPMSTIFVTSSQSVPTALKDKTAQIKDLLRRRTDIEIQADAELPRDNVAMFQKEQYTNFSQADVKLHYDTDQYRILPGGKELYNCSNTLAAQLDPSDPDYLKSQGTNSCIPESSEEQKELDTMHGLMVGCGQNIVYGWTLQKCNFDFDIVFVVDTSSSMTYDKSGTQRKKIDIAKDQLKEFVDFASANYGSKTRVSLVSRCV